MKANAAQCFSIVSPIASLHLEANTPKEAEQWSAAMRFRFISAVRCGVVRRQAEMRNVLLAVAKLAMARSSVSGLKSPELVLAFCADSAC